MLQSQVSRVHKNKKYVKFWVVVPKKLIDKLGWKNKDELEPEVKSGKLLIKKEDHENSQ
jgi:bifunctional DNA-binding transcriptional regulator/antitoxin component of YhaV-PrlF toxin-antitoxin module